MRLLELEVTSTVGYGSITSPMEYLLECIPNDIIEFPSTENSNMDFAIDSGGKTY